MGSCPGSLNGKNSICSPVGAEGLPEVALLPQQADADHRHAQVAGRLEEVAGQDAQAAAVDGQGLAEAELHAEVGDGPGTATSLAPVHCAAGR